MPSQAIFIPLARNTILFAVNVGGKSRVVSCPARSHGPFLPLCQPHTLTALPLCDPGTGCLAPEVPLHMCNLDIGDGTEAPPLALHSKPYRFAARQCLCDRTRAVSGPCKAWALRASCICETQRRARDMSECYHSPCAPPGAGPVWGQERMDNIGDSIKGRESGVTKKSRSLGASVRTAPNELLQRDTHGKCQQKVGG